MKYVLLFLLMCFLGGAGGALGAVVLGGLGRGGALAGGFLGGAPSVVLGAMLAARWEWIRSHQRFWAAIGGLIGFGLAILVTLSTLSTQAGPLLGAALIGAGADLGAVMGRSAHDDEDC